MTQLFFYGTLCHLPLLRAVLGRDDPDVVPAALADHAVFWVDGASFPMIAAQPGAQAQGVILRGATEADIARLSHYEGAYGYGLVPVSPVSTGGAGAVQALAFFPESADLRPGAPWDLAAWVAEWGAITVSAAPDFMALMGAQDPATLEAIRPFTMARGWARQLGHAGAPARLRHSPAPGDLVARALPGGYHGFFGLRRLALSFRLFSGQMTPELQREAFLAFDAALVLPYDPQRDEVLLIEQLRFGPILREDPNPWVLEPVAGLVDAGEDPADCARREAEEEAHLTLRAVLPMARGYASPGYSSEFFHMFCGLADLSAHHGTIAGIAEDSENIRSHVLPLDDALALIDTGEINATPLITMVLWVAANRARLRALA